MPVPRPPGAGSSGDPGWIGLCGLNPGALLGHYGRGIIYSTPPKFSWEEPWGCGLEQSLDSGQEMEWMHVWAKHTIAVTTIVNTAHTADSGVGDSDVAAMT